MYSRLTTATMYGSLIDSLLKSQRNVQDLQQQIASGNKYTRLSDNPSAVTRSLTIQSALNANDQYQSNTTNAITMLRYSNSALQNVLDAAQTIRDLIIQAGNAALDSTQLKDITAQIEANKKIMLDNLNTRIAGQYIFGGNDTSTPPFAELSDGSIVYQGANERIQYAVSESLVGDVSFAGSDIVQENEDTYFICSHYVPLDWEWTGREEKVQITVGNRTLSVFIPENWIDEITTGTGSNNVTDYNQFRDPSEVTGISLSDLATLINRSLEEQGADMLVTAHVEQDTKTGSQQMIIRSNTGEKIGITGWTDTDYMPMAQTLTSKSVSSVMTADELAAAKEADPNFTVDEGIICWNEEANIADNGKYTSKDEALNGIMGSVNLLSWPNGLTGTMSITIGNQTEEIDLSKIGSATSLVDEINNKFTSTKITDIKPSTGTEETSYMPVASISAGKSGRLILQSSSGPITVTGAKNILSYNDDTVKSSLSSLNIQIGSEPATKVYINDGETISDVAEKINAIEGLYSRTSANGKQLIITAQRIGDQQSDRLSQDAAIEALHYPSLSIHTRGVGASKLFEFQEFDANYDNYGTISDRNSVVRDENNNIISGSITSTLETRPVDHSHIDVFDVLGMETGMKSVEFAMDQTLEVKSGENLHWRVMNGEGKAADIVLTAGNYSMSDIAERLSNAGAGWLEVTVDVFNANGTNGDANENIPVTKTDTRTDSTLNVTEGGNGTSKNSEAQTQRLVIRGMKGEQILLLDMNNNNYADALGLSTALRTEAYTGTHTGTGTKCVNFPSAPCVDDNSGVQVRVQMNCGMYYDVDIRKTDVMNAKTGFVDRTKVMQQIVSQVNEQEGHEIMGFTQHVDDSGKDIDESCSIYFLSGESFTVVDMPFSDPEWNDYSGGIAAQMGIHGGVTSNMAQTSMKIKDNQSVSAAAGSAVEGTIKFSNLAHTVEIDVSSDDTVKSIMDRLRSQAGDWLYVNYYDTHMGQDDTRNTGDYPIIAISSVDGSAVSVVDMKGSIAQDILGISTGVQGRADISSFTWDENNTPAETLTISVAGYEHTIDLTAMVDVTANDTTGRGRDGKITAYDMACFINARMQDYDIKADINEDGCLVVWSPRGYDISLSFNGGTDSTEFFTTGGPSTAKNYYRGGYNLEGSAEARDTTGNHSQNVTIRSGANTTRQNGFGVINDIISAINSGNRDNLTDNMLPRIDNFINNILSVMSENGALQARYNYNNERLVTENAIMSEEYDNVAKIDPAEAIAQLMVADYMYQANLAVIARLIQPSLLDFLS